MSRRMLALAALLMALCGSSVAVAQAADAAVAEGEAEPEPEAALPYPNDPLFHSQGSWEQEFDDQWALKALRVYTDVTRSIEPPEDQPPVVVAVIDTGLDYLHADFAAEQLWQNPEEERNRRDDDSNDYVDDLIGWNFVDNNNNPWDQSGHGTHISGIIAACTDNGVGISAVNPDAVVMPLKVANFVGQARSSMVASAIYYAVDNGARVINLSLGGELVTQAERGAAQYAHEQGVLIVVSAGNKGLDAGQFGYAGLPHVLVVAASDLNGERAGFSNFGADVEVIAPGVDVLSLRARDTDFIALSNPPDYPEGAAFVGEDEAYYRASGTSFAAAEVSGMASRIMTLRPELSADEVRRLLVQTALDVGTPGVDQRSGYGRVDLVRALGGKPDEFVEARLAGIDLELKNQRVWINFSGIADAADFASATVEIKPAVGALPEPPSDEDDGKRKKRKSKKEREAEAAAAQARAQLLAWQQAFPPLAAPVRDGVLGSVDLEALVKMTGGATSWEIRLLVETATGERREARMAMALPPPPVAETEEVAGE
jgi:subtilisin family serine protease